MSLVKYDGINWCVEHIGDVLYCMLYSSDLK